MKLYKKISITVLSLMLVFVGTFVLNSFIMPRHNVKAVSEPVQKYFYLSDMETSSKTTTIERNTGYVTLKRGGGGVCETFVKNIVIVDNGSVSFALKGLNAERFIAYVGIDIKDKEDNPPTQTATVTVKVDGNEQSTISVNSTLKYEHIDVSLLDAKNITFTVTGATSGARIVLANPKLFGANLLYGYTENNALELSNLPHFTSDDTNITYPAPYEKNIDFKIREDNTNKIYLSSYDGATADSPAKVGWDLEGIGAYYFSVQVETAGVVQFRIKYFEGYTIKESILQGNVNSGTYNFAIPSKATQLILATYGGGTTFVNPILYCNNYAILSDENIRGQLTEHNKSLSFPETKPSTQTGYVGEIQYNYVPILYNKVVDASNDTLRKDNATLSYHLEKSNANSVAQFNKCIFIHPNEAQGIVAGWVRFDLANMHLTRFSSFVGVESRKVDNSADADGVNFIANYYDYFDKTTYPLRATSIDGITYNNGAKGNQLNYMDVVVPMGAQSITLISKMGNKINSDHSIWAAPIVFGNNIISTKSNVTIPKLQSDANNHYRGNEFSEAHNYGSYSYTNSQHSRTCIDCGYVQTSNHTYDVTVDVEATCTTTGTSTFTCVCGYSYSAEQPVLAHDMGDWFMTTFVTANNPVGQQQRNCQNCSHYETESVGADNKASLSLKETIGLNLYIDATKYTADTNAYVELTYNHNSTSYVPYYTTDVIYLNQLVPDNDKLYKFSMSFASGQIADTISLKLYNGQKNLLYSKMDYSILEYCQEIINDVNQTDKLKNLCKAIINYGITSINYFDYSTNLANPNSYKQTIEGVAQEISNVPNATIEQGAKYLSVSRFSFITLSDTSIRVYFDTSGFIFNDNYVVTLTKPTLVNTDMSYKTGVNDYGYFVEVYGIESANIDKLFTITISFKGDEQNKTIITYSALNYLKEKEQDVNSSSLLKELCLVIYQYNICAKNYFDNN